MFYKFVLLLFLAVVFNSCFMNTYYATKNASLYHRDMVGDGGLSTYSDVVVLKNYHNKSKTFKQLYEIAKNYIDTVKAKLPVTQVTFIGQSPAGYLSKPDNDVWDNSQSNAIISFAFDNEAGENKNKNNVELNSFFIYKNSTARPYLLYLLPPRTLDSCMNSTTPIDTGF